ncbi:hypothetical protein J437_LFUL016526 [Ladona fulva]|uniref:Cuticle protein 6 n=1 Tax=Ladona fulva TaxID=123851 RepID=A0A8K0KPI5_LADFU|nr:hypothetical protein J437_LFUL016526 [Ladona fulva]
MQKTEQRAMRSLLIVLSVVGVAFARPGLLGLGLGARSLLHAPLAYSTVAAPVTYSTYAAAPIAYAGHAISSQYHAQDELGQYSYGYAGGPSAKSEVKTFDGVTRGGYSYIDANGKVQTVNYVSDPIYGFRVAATNLPVGPAPIAAEPLASPLPVQDTPEVSAAKEEHRIAFEKAKAAADAAPDVDIIDESTPVAVAPAAVAVAPASVTKTVVAHSYAPALTYGAVAPSVISVQAVAPAVAPAHITYQAAVAPVTRYAYSAIAPAVTYAAAAPAIAHAPVAYAGHLGVSSQYHAQDELGQYSYGYAGGPSAKSELKTFDGVTRGGYSYIDANGKVQTVNYIADPINGFRVAATNLPVAPVADAAPLLQTIADTPEVAAAKIVLSVVGIAFAKPGALGLGFRSLLHAPLVHSRVAAPVAYSTVAAAPIAYAGHHAVSSQYHAQDELGQYSYGYAGGPSAKSEVKTFDGVTRGGYSYVDAAGKVQTVNYVADGLGFRVAATNLPVGPAPIAAEPLAAPLPVQDTPEVAAAKEEHRIAYAKAKAAADAAPDVNIIEAAAPVAIAPAAVAIAPASVTNSVFAHTYAPALAYGAIAPAAVQAIAPAVAPAHITYQAAVAPVSRFSYSTVQPAVSYAAYSAPVAHAIAPAPIVRSAVVAPAPIAYAGHHAVSSQYHAQDELGQYSYGYAGGPSAKSELKTFDGVTRGGYSYVDANGQVQSVNYVADAVHGFRVAATNLPVAPVADAAPLVQTVVDTPEVAAAKAEHFAAVAEAKARNQW